MLTPLPDQPDIEEAQKNLRRWSKNHFEDFEDRLDAFHEELFGPTDEE